MEFRYDNHILFEIVLMPLLLHFPLFNFDFWYVLCLDFHMVVEEMNILTTVFLRLDNQKIIYPNSILSTKPISNYYRSPDMGDSIDFCVHIATPIEKIAIIRQRIIRYRKAISPPLSACSLFLLPFSIILFTSASAVLIT